MRIKLLFSHRRHRVAMVVFGMVTFLFPIWADAQNVIRMRRINETEWKEGPLDSNSVDWSLFPRAYGILADERLMYPVDASDWPVKVGPERQLFVDNYLVAESTFVKRTVHQPVKDSRNPIMVAREPWEQTKKVIILQTLRDPDTGKFRMWYTSWVQFKYPGTDIRGRMPTLYAESEDGIHWERPKLGLLEHDGSKDNNWVIYGRMYGLIHEPDAVDSERRYLAAVLHEPPYVEVEGLYLYASPDGLRWQRIREKPIIILLHKDRRFPLQGIGDTTIVRYDSLLKLYVTEAKIPMRRVDDKNYGNFNPTFRARGICTSEDLIHWSRLRMTLYPDGQDDADAQFYGNVTFVYESMWLGMLRVFHHARTGWKQVDVELTTSRDGLNWERAGNREIFLPLGDEDSWERDYTDPSNNGPLLVGDELWFFYRGSRNLVPEKKAGLGVGGHDWEFAVGLAKLRRDGFVSIDAADQPGTLVTRPLTIQGDRLHINAAVAPGGEIRVGLLDYEGKPIRGYTTEACSRITGDSTDVKVDWGRSDLDSVIESHEHVRLKFEMRKAQLYSFWVD